MTIRPRNDLYCAGLDVKPYSLIQSLLMIIIDRLHTVLYNVM